MKRLNVKQVASYFAVHPLSVLRWIKQGKIRAVKIGREYSIDPDSLKHLFFSEKEFKEFLNE